MATVAELIDAAARHYAAGDLNRAEQVAREALAADVHLAEAWRLLGSVASKRNNAAQAIEFLNRSLACDRAHPETWMNLADIDRIVGNLPSALGKYEQTVALQPDYGEAHDRMGVVLWKLGRWNEALAAFERAAQLRPNDAEIACHAGECLREIGQPDRAIDHYKNALSLNPSQSGAARGLGFALTQVGLLDEGIAHLRDALTQQPLQPQIYHSLTQMAVDGWCELTAGELEGIKTIVGSAQYSPFDRSQCAFAFAAILHERGAYDEAMRYYHHANELKKYVLSQQGIHFDAARHEAWVERIISAFDASYFERTRRWGNGSELPIFIVGMPRSGSTLVEQILASHPQVYGAGEFGDFHQFMKRTEPALDGAPYAVPMAADQGAMQRLAAAYLDWIRGFDPKAARIVNKTLHNFLHLGAITALFPRARIIHCRRDPLDTCLSCYITNFKIVDFAWTLADIGAYYRTYEKLMAHWGHVLPAPIKEVRYEDLVDNPQSVSRELVAWCGLEWDERCLEPHKTRRVVKTASAIQVRRPIHKRAVGRWQLYREHLGPLFAALGLE
jgi:tetratricopeptide (TPR) repeat protein